MEKRWDTKPLVIQTIAAGIFVAVGALLLPAVGLAMGVLARQFGTMLGEALAAVLHDVFSALGIFVPRHELLEIRLPEIMAQFRGLCA